MVKGELKVCKHTFRINLIEASQKHGMNWISYGLENAEVWYDGAGSGATNGPTFLFIK